MAVKDKGKGTTTTTLAAAATKAKAKATAEATTTVVTEEPIDKELVVFLKGIIAPNGVRILPQPVNGLVGSVSIDFYMISKDDPKGPTMITREPVLTNCRFPVMESTDVRRKGQLWVGAGQIQTREYDQGVPTVTVDPETHVKTITKNTRSVTYRNFDPKLELAGLILEVYSRHKASARMGSVSSSSADIQVEDSVRDILADAIE